MYRYLDDRGIVHAVQTKADSSGPQLHQLIARPTISALVIHLKKSCQIKKGLDKDLIFRYTPFGVQ